MKQPYEQSENAPLSILWDNDGVLVDSERFYYQSAIEVMAPYGVEIDEPTYIEHSLVKCASIFDFVRQRGVDEAEIDRIRQRRIARLDELMADAGDCFVPGAEDLLNDLHNRGVSMGCVTGSQRDHFDLLHRSDRLTRYLRFVVSREDYEQAKPDPEPYQRGLDRGGFEADRCVVVEDSPRGMRSAVAAGVRCIVIANQTVRRTADLSPAWRIVDSLDGAHAAIRTLM
jgi:HAD superfamily hydrolase (TIGR01509 family)